MQDQVHVRSTQCRLGVGANLDAHAFSRDRDRAPVDRSVVIQHPAGRKRRPTSKLWEVGDSCRSNSGRGGAGRHALQSVRTELGCTLVLVAGVITFVKPLRWEQWNLVERRQSAARIAAGLCILASACWFQWIYQLEAITPVDPDQQSAYSYGTFAERHHWHDIRAEREHYWGDDIRSLEPRRLVRDLDKVTAIAAGVAGIVAATFLLSVHDAPRRRVLAALAVFGVLGALFPFLVGGSIPGPGAVLAVIGIGLASWALRQRDGPEAF